LFVFSWFSSLLILFFPITHLLFYISTFFLCLH
jgi:hypothetical protein